MPSRIVNKLPFRFVIAVPFTLLILFAVGLTGYLSYRNGQMAVNQLATDLHKETVAHIGQVLDNYLSTPVLINQLNLDAIHLGTLDVHNLDTIESNFLAQMQHFETVISVAYANEQREYIGPGRKVLGADIGVGISSEKTGYVLEAYEITPEGARKLIFTLPDYDPRTRPWYQAAVQVGRQVWTPIYLWSSGDVGIDAVVPVYSNDNKLLGVLSTSLTMDAIGAYLQNLKGSEHGESFIVERSGLLVASSAIHEPFTRAGDELKRLSVLEVKDPVMKAAVHALEQKVGPLENITDALSFNFELSNERYLARVVPYRDEYGLDWLIVTVIPESDFMAQVNVGNRQTGMLIGLSLLVSIILAALITLWVTHPIVQLNDSARALASGEWGRRVRVNRTDEIGELSKSFNHMAEQLQASFVSIQASEKRYRAVVENQTEFIVRWKADGVRTFANDAYRRYFDLTPEQTGSSSFMPLVVEEDRSALEEKLSRLLSGTVTAETDIHRVIKPDGSIGWQEWIDQAIYDDETKQIVEFQSVGRDITKRKQAEEALREKTEESERFFISALDLLCIADTDGYFRRLNREWEKVLGYRLEDLEGKRFLDLIHPDDLQATLGAMAKLDAQKEILDFTNRYRCKDGTYRWFEWRSIPHGKLIYAAARDITERKRIETALQESEKRYRDLVEFSPVAITVHVEGRIVYINPAGTKLWGCDKPDEVLGRSPLDFVHPDYHERITERIRRIQAMEQSLPPIEVKNTRLDGQILYTVGTGIPITYGSKPAILSVVLDITERVRAEERLRELTRRLVVAQEEERKRIAQELHDELGQALTAISLDLGGIEKALPPETFPGIRERLIDARSLADEVDERISELALDLRPSLLDDLGLLPTLQWYLNRYSQRLGIEVAMDFKDLESRLPGEVETTLYRVIQEALTNIARHAQAGTVRLSLERSATAVAVTIQDDGRGFDVEEVQSSAASLGGVGLLGINDRVSTLGGRVEIHSRPGQGVRIQIEIPL